jgi:alpha-beta hydrolase superfamily lysophospholipase
MPISDPSRGNRGNEGNLECTPAPRLYPGVWNKGGFMADYSQIDRSSLIGFLFYPRQDFTPCPQGAFDLLVPVEPGISISTRFYEKNKGWPWILYFHGNGEVVSDYDDIAPLYHRKNTNLVVADYRGYGLSGGSPSFSHLISDGRKVLEKVKVELAKRGFRKDLWVMGRSMGSVAALDLAYHFSDEVQGMIIESGFVSVTRLIKHLGLPAEGIDLEPIEQERIEMIRKISTPALIIHGEVDSLVPLQEAKDLFAYLQGKQKKLVIIPNADHNSVMAFGLEQYFQSISEFVAVPA